MILPTEHFQPAGATSHRGATLVVVGEYPAWISVKAGSSSSFDMTASCGDTVGEWQPVESGCCAPRAVAATLTLGNNTTNSSVSLGEYEDFVTQLSDHDGVLFFSPWRHFCGHAEESKCGTDMCGPFVPGGALGFHDSHHLSYVGALHVGLQFGEFLRACRFPHGRRPSKSPMYASSNDFWESNGYSRYDG